MGLSIQSECRKCGISNTFPSDFAIEESIQVGCSHCNNPEINRWPKYHAEYNSGSDVWVIFKEELIQIKLFIFFGPLVTCGKSSVLRADHHYDFGPNSESTAPELEFDTLKEAKDYIKRLEGK